MTLEERLDAVLGPPPADRAAMWIRAYCALSLLGLYRQIDERVDAALAALPLDKAGESARRSLGQRARWIARDFHLRPEK